MADAWLEAPIKIFLVGNHPIFRRGIVECAKEEPSVVLCGFATEPRSAIAQIHDLRPDLAIIDISSPPIGLDLLTELSEDEVKTKIILLTGYTQDNLARAVLLSGAGGYLFKSAEWKDLLAAIKTVFAGGTIVGEEVVAAFRKGLRQQKSVAPLTTKETDMMSLVAEGCSIALIANRLSIGQSTVKTHLQHTFSKLGVNNQAAAVAEAIRQGFI